MRDKGVEEEAGENAVKWTLIVDDSAPPSLPGVAQRERVCFDPKCQLICVSALIEHDICDVVSNWHFTPSTHVTAAGAH